MNYVERSNRFGRHDRLTIDNQSYRVVKKEGHVFLLQLVSDDLIQEYYVTKSDRQINELSRLGRMKCDRDYFSKTLGMLRQRHDSSDISDLSEDALRKVAWQTEWCVRFNRARIDTKAAWRPTKTPKGLLRFILSEKELMDRWYLDKYGERRPPGRKFKGLNRKPFDYPSGSALRNWLTLFREAKERVEAFRPHYDLCGNRNQIDPRVVPLVTECVKGYATSLRPRMNDICEDVESGLEKLNAGLPEEKHISVSATAIRRRIHKLDPFTVEANREGIDRVRRRYTPVGMGLQILTPMERIEIDDWEFDLQTLMTQSPKWKALPAKKKKHVPKMRCTATVAIDVATPCIVGFHLSASAPSTPGSKSALRSVMIDKSATAKWAKCQSDWPMYGQPDCVATDGGPAFQGDFLESLRLTATNRHLGDMDPRMRGTIEAFFRYFKRVCRYFSGQTFANVVEKGDYRAEDMASLPFAELYKFAVRFIVDSYHHRPHRGLEGCTPYNQWKRLTKQFGLALPPGKLQLIRAFGYPLQRTVDKHGILALGLSYNDKNLSMLHRKIGQGKDVGIVIDPDDLGAILVRVPKEFRTDKDLKMNGDYLVVDSVGNCGAGVTLEQRIATSKAILQFAKAEEAAGKPIRLAAHRDLVEGGERARRAAGLQEFFLTQEELTKASNAMDQKARAGFSTPDHATAPPPEGGQIGKRVAVSRRKHKTRAVSPSPTRPTNASEDGDDDRMKPEPSQRPFSGSMNTYGDDE